MERKMNQSEIDARASAFDSAYFNIVNAMQSVRLDMNRAVDAWVIATLVFRKIQPPQKITAEWMRKNHIQFLEVSRFAEPDVLEIHHKNELIGQFKLM